MIETWTCGKCGRVCPVHETACRRCDPQLFPVNANCGDCALWRPLSSQDRRNASHGRCALTDGRRLFTFADRCDKFVPHWKPAEGTKAPPPLLLPLS